MTVVYLITYNWNEFYKVEVRPITKGEGLMTVHYGWDHPGDKKVLT